MTPTPIRNWGTGVHANQRPGTAMRDPANEPIAYRAGDGSWAPVCGFVTETGNPVSAMYGARTPAANVNCFRDPNAYDPAIGGYGRNDVFPSTGKDFGYWMVPSGFWIQSWRVYCAVKSGHAKSTSTAEPA